MQITVNDNTEYILRSSHGKDSLKCLDVIVSRGLPLDRITTTDVWATDTIRGELPEMVKFKDWVDGYIWGKYRIEVEHLCAMKNGEKLTYEKMFYHIPKRKNAGGVLPETWNDSRIPDTMGPLVPTSSQSTTAIRKAGLCRRGHGAKNSSIYGFPVSVKRGVWCQKLKTRFLSCPPTRGKTNIVEYLGIAADEPERFGQLSETKRAPLVEFGIEEGLCGLYCQYEGILAPSYENGERDGCWMCHNQGVNQLRLLRKNHPELWKLLMKWDRDSPVTFKADGHTVHDFDLRFQLEDEGIIKLDEPFRWSNVYEPQLRLF